MHAQASHATRCAKVQRTKNTKMAASAWAVVEAVKPGVKTYSQKKVILQARAAAKQASEAEAAAQQGERLASVESRIAEIEALSQAKRERRMRGKE